MVKGFSVWKWSIQEGLLLIRKFPEELEISTQDMMRVFYNHITGAEKQENVVLRLPSMESSIASHFTGVKSKAPYMINVILELGEDPELFGNVITRINEEVMEILTILDEKKAGTLEIYKELDEYFKKMFALFQRLTNLSKEQKVAQIYSNPKGHQIMTLLQEGPISKKELRYNLEKNLNQVISNLELTLDPYTETDIIKEDWIEGDKDQYIFLMKDFTIMRGPATKIIEKARKNKPTPGVAKQYLKQVSEFFSKYKPSSEDGMKIAGILMHPDMYDILRLFSFESHNYQKIPPGYGGPEMKKIIDLLIQEKILTIIKEDKAEWVMLLSDVDIALFFPEYLLEKIRIALRDGKIKKQAAIKHLNLLEKSYSKGA
ncbi:MAG: hypothetical protein HWN67_22420 [Candidatus Helarchaeota archaeon]|nr:hypothetical protein [Candidatus Helarchaeota archaeon]